MLEYLLSAFLVKVDQLLSLSHLCFFSSLLQLIFSSVMVHTQTNRKHLIVCRASWLRGNVITSRAAPQQPQQANRRQWGALLLAVAIGVLLGLRSDTDDASSSTTPAQNHGHCNGEGDWQCFSPDRQKRKLDPTFAGYVVRSSFAALLEDSAVGGVNQETGETDKGRAREILVEIDLEYDKARRDLGLPDQRRGDDGFPANEDLRDSRVFDAYSYAQFKVAERRLTASRERRAITERAGVRLLSMMRELARVDPSGDASDLDAMRESLSKILRVFVDVGYVLGSGTSWPENAKEEYEKNGAVTFQYWMKDPVILPSARKLFAEEGFAQHFSSRTIENLFAGYMTRAREDEDFDPRDWPDDRVVEQWSLTSMA